MIGPERRLELTVRTWFRDERQGDELAQAFSEVPGVVGFAVLPVHDDVAADFSRGATGGAAGMTAGRPGERGRMRQRAGAR